VSPGARGQGIHGAALAALLLGAVGVLGSLEASPGGPLALSPTGAAPGGPSLALGAHFMDGPPARVTGGFGEDSCHACHWDFDLNDPEGSFRVEGVPEHFVPGESYTITLVLTRSGMRSGGFQFAARFQADSSQAGVLEAHPEEVERVEVATDREVQFAQHRLGGTDPLRPHTTAWTVLWTAPWEPDAGAVLFHASAVAGDGDRSQVGDLVYVVEERVAPAGG